MFENRADFFIASYLQLIERRLDNLRDEKTYYESEITRLVSDEERMTLAARELLVCRTKIEELEEIQEELSHLQWIA